MRTLGSFFIVFVQGQNRFEGLMTIQANIIVEGHGNLPWGTARRIVTPRGIVKRDF
jgi:hypothetical protein